MTEFVGLKNIFDLFFTEDISAQFKREALLVDRVGIIGFDVFLKTKNKRPIVDGSDEMIWLYEQGFIFNPPDIRKMRPPILNPQFDDITHFLVHEGIALRELERRSFRQRKKNKFIERGMMSEQMSTHLTSIYLREKENVDNCSLFRHEGPKEYLKFRFAEPRDTPSIILKALPIPSSTTAWEHINEYRSDSNSQSKFLALRNWMNDLSRSDLKPNEIEQKLIFLVDQYQNHMKLHKMKTRKGTLETIVVTSAELIENIAKLKLSEAAKKLFSFRERKINLLETELSAPGREVAYILDAHERFRN